MSKEKHFLDTSVLRPIMLGTEVYKQHFQYHFGDNALYTSKYILMEFKRSYICNIIDFYFVLDMPNMITINDALTFWSHKYTKSELKAIIQFISQIINSYQLSIDNPKEKEKALLQIGRYIKRIELKLRRRFLDIGKNETHCYRALIAFKNYGDIKTNFMDFIQEFKNNKLCRSKCDIDKFFYVKYKNFADQFIAYCDKLENPSNVKNKGFKDIVENLRNALDENKFSCSLCDKIGDSVIALEAPRNMRLEHTDHSFDHLCSAIKQPHFKHPSETEIVKFTASILPDTELTH